MFRKIFVLSAIALILSVFVSPISVSADEDTWWWHNDFRFEYVNNVMTITDYRGPSGSIVIPRQAPNDSYVYVIGFRAFDNANLNNVTFQSGSRVHTIADEAFRRSGVRAITFPSSLRTIGERAFEDSRLTTVTIPDRVEYISDHAFRDNPLREAHFEHTDGRDIDLGTNIFSRVAENFIITHPRNATHFGRNWYTPHSTFAVDSVEAREADWRWTTLAGNAVMITGYHPDSRLADAESIEIPSQIAGRTVRSIGNRAFDNHPYLEEVIIPDTVTRVYQRAFNNNRFLRAAYFRHGDGNAVDVHRDAFTGSHHSFTIRFPYGARGFTSPEWNGFRAEPTDVGGIWEFSPLGGGVDLMITAYNGTASVVEIPSFLDGRPVRYIGSEAFRDNNHIVEIIVPASIVHIQANAVMSAPNLRIVRLRHMHADTLDLSGHAFSGVHRDFTIIFPADATGFTSPLVGFPAEPDLIAANWEYTIAGGIATITRYLGTDQDVEIPSYIGGSPVRVIASGAFQNNDTMTRVVIPRSVNRIEANAFHNCINLNAAHLEHTNTNQFTSFSRDSFVGVALNFRLIVPDNAVGFGTNWNGYFVETESDALTLREGNFEFVIRREPVVGMAVATRDAVTITRYFGLAVDLEIPSTLGGFPVTGIGDFAFMQALTIRRVAIPASVTSIGHSAFLNASNLESATFLHPNGEGITLHANTFRYTAPNFTIIFPGTSAGFTTPFWQNWPARPQHMPNVPGQTTPGVPTVPGQFPSGTLPPSGLNNPLINTSRVLNSHDHFFTRDGEVLVAPIFRLETFPVNPHAATSYVMIRVIADILGLDWSFEPATGTATFSGYNALNQFIVMEVTINSTIMRVNGVPREVRAAVGVVPAISRDGRMFVPVAIFNEVFGVTIQWNGANQTVTVNP